MNRRLVFAPEARADLRRLSARIAKDSGAARAATFVGRIETYCFDLTDFPERGTMRDDLWPGLRTVGFERRATIAFGAPPSPLR
jgi:toxin ParE1/3/4